MHVMLLGVTVLDARCGILPDTWSTPESEVYSVTIDEEKQQIVVRKPCLGCA